LFFNREKDEGETLVDQRDVESLTKDLGILNDDTLERVEVLPSGAFIPGQIHEASVFKFWRDELGASKWVLDTLVDGYKIPFDRMQKKFEKKTMVPALNK